MAENPQSIVLFPISKGFKPLVSHLPSATAQPAAEMQNGNGELTPGNGWH